MRKKAFYCTLLGLVSSLAQAGIIEYTFTEGPPVFPVTTTLAGTEEDWILEPNRDNVDPTWASIDFSAGHMLFIDDAGLAGNLGLMTQENASLREQYKLSGPGDRIWLVCDYKMNEYGYRADGTNSSVDNTRAQVFWFTFLNSMGTGFGINYVAGNFNSEEQVYFTSIGNGDQNQTQYRSPGYIIEEGASPNLNRRTVILRITESLFSGSVIVDVKYDNGPYKRVSNFFNGVLSTFPAGNGTGDNNVLLTVGNYSGSGAIEFEMYRLALTDEDPAPNATGGNEPIALRKLPLPTISVGGELGVDIDLFNPLSSPQSVMVMENVTTGYSAIEISDGGIFQNGIITWNLTLAPGAKSIRYKLKAPLNPNTPPTFSGMIGDLPVSGESSALLKRDRTPKVTAWNPPANGWNYIYDPDLGSPEDIALDGWSHNNGSDAYIFQPTLPSTSENAGAIWRNPAFIDDESFAGKALRIYDPGNTQTMIQYINAATDPSNRKITLNFNLGTATKAVAAFRVRSREFVDEFGVTIPFGYPDASQYPLLGLAKNVAATDWAAWDNLSGSGLFFDPNYPDSLNFPYSDVLAGPRIPGFSEFGWDHTQWHEYWVTWSTAVGEKTTALYVDGQKTPLISYPLATSHPFYEDSDEFRDAQQRGAFFNRTNEADADIPTGNTVFKITLRNTGDAGNLEIDYIALASGTNESPTGFVGIGNWSLY